MDHHRSSRGLAAPDGYEAWRFATSETECAGSEPPILQTLPIAPLPGFDTIYGTWLDECLSLRGTEGSNLLKYTLMCIEGSELCHGKKRRRIDYQENFELLVECIIANALRTRVYRESDWVAYRRKNGGYWSGPSWINGEALARNVDLLIEVGLLKGCVGERGGASSIYSMSSKLVEMVVHLRVTAEHIERRIPNVESLIILRSDDDEKSEIRYEPTEETLAWAEKLDQYNHFVERHEVRLVLSEDEKAQYIDSVHEKRSHFDRQPKMVEPEFFRRHLYRIFNDGRWDHGGRFYRAWWQNTPSGLRRKITIDGETTAELDFSGFLPRSLYHLHDKPYPADDDPYDIPELTSYAEELGKAEDHFREANKKLLIALLNGDKIDGHPETVKLNISYLPRYSRPDVEALIAKKHPFLAEMFRSGEGKRNQRLDSDIALEVMSKLMGKGILVLPIHDSFVIKAKFKNALFSEMVEAYRARLGFEPVIKEVVEK